MRHRFRILAAIAAFVMANAARADSPARPSSYMKPVGDAYVFVMLLGGCERTETRRLIVSTAEYAELRAQVNRRDAADSGNCRDELRSANDDKAPPDMLSLVHEVREYSYDTYFRTSSGDVYPASGLYRNDGSVEPLWTVKWFAQSVDITSDGRYLIRRGGWAGSPTEIGVAFYDRGILLQSYRIDELVSDFSKVQPTISHFFWRRREQLDDAARTYHLITYGRDDYVFDLATGDIVSHAGPPTARFDAEITLADGTRHTVAAFAACQGAMLLANADASEHSLVATVRGKEHLASVVFIPFADLAAVNIKASDGALHEWALSTHDGSVHTLTVDTAVAPVKYCGKEGSGAQRTYTLDTIREIVFSYVP